MNRVKSIARWFVLPFGSLKILLILLVVFLLSRVADLASTYWFLSQAEFDITKEANPLMRLLFRNVGIFGGLLVNLIYSPVFMLLYAAFLFHEFLRIKYLRFANIFPVAFFLYASILGFLVTVLGK